LGFHNQAQGWRLLAQSPFLLRYNQPFYLPAHPRAALSSS
jgi:hypothetical protein